MAKIKVRYLINRKRGDGTARYYWQPDANLRKHGWKMKRLSDDETTAIREAQAINANLDEWRVNKETAKTTETRGTVGWLIENYKGSRDFQTKAEKTRKDYIRYLTLINSWPGDQPARAITKKDVQILYDVHRDKHPRKAAFIIQVVRLLFSYAERQGIIAMNMNPAVNPRIDYKAQKGRLWTPENVMTFVRTADKTPDDFAIGTAVMINEWIGQRPGDMLSFPQTSYRGGVFHIRQSKRGAEVCLSVDIVPALKQRLEEQIRRNNDRPHPGATLIQRPDGTAYDVDSFNKSFQRIRRQAALEDPAIAGLVNQHLRHTAVTRLAEAGCTIPEIASITGHSFKAVQDIIDRYNIRTTKMAHSAFMKRLKAERN